MLRTVLEIVAWVLIFMAIRAFLRGVFSRPHVHVESRPPPPPSVPAGGELKKDPVCGTYISTATSVKRTLNGEVLHFCSKECRDRYRGPSAD